MIDKDIVLTAFGKDPSGRILDGCYRKKAKGRNIYRFASKNLVSWYLEAGLGKLNHTLKSLRDADDVVRAEIKEKTEARNAAKAKANANGTGLDEKDDYDKKIDEAKIKVKDSSFLSCKKKHFYSPRLIEALGEDMGDGYRERSVELASSIRKGLMSKLPATRMLPIKDRKRISLGEADPWLVTRKLQSSIAGGGEIFGYKIDNAFYVTITDLSHFFGISSGTLRVAVATMGLIFSPDKCLFIGMNISIRVDVVTQVLGVSRLKHLRTDGIDWWNKKFPNTSAEPAIDVKPEAPPAPKEPPVTPIQTTLFPPAVKPGEPFEGFYHQENSIYVYFEFHDGFEYFPVLDESGVEIKKTPAERAQKWIEKTWANHFPRENETLESCFDVFWGKRMRVTPEKVVVKVGLK